MATPETMLTVKKLSRVFGDRVRLHVADLAIYRGEMVFLVGQSGCGKTTLLETLGLLTPAEDRGLSANEICYYPDTVPNGVMASSLWGDPDLMVWFRKQCLSFIFQSSNLMDIFTVKENAGVTRLIQGDDATSSLAQAKVRLNDVLPEKGDDELDGSHTNYSGGQRQRVSFARAICKDFELLLADEPTGSLGLVDAHRVMALVHRRIHEPASGKAPAAVVVSHDINLALFYADRIVLMGANGQVDMARSYQAQPCALPDVYEVDEGKLDETSGEKIEATIAAKWGAALGGDNGATVPSIRRRVLSETVEIVPFPADLPVNEATGHLLKPDDHDGKRDAGAAGFPTAPPADPQRPLSGDGGGFGRWFMRSQWYKNILSLRSVYLVLLLGIVFLSIGFGQGGLSLLERNMRDPYIRWVKVELPSGFTVEQAELAVEEIDTNDVENLQIAHVSHYTQYARSFYIKNQNDTATAYARTINHDNPLLREILAPDNLIGGGPFDGEQSMAVIVTQDFVERFCTDEEPAFVKVRYKHGGDVTFATVPITAIVKSLPGRASLLCTPYYLEQSDSTDDVFFSGSSDFAYLHYGPRGRSAVSPDDVLNAACEINDLLRTVVNRVAERLNPQSQPIVVNPVAYKDCWRPGAVLRIRFASPMTRGFRDAFAEEVRDEPELVDYDLKILSGFVSTRHPGYRPPTNLSLFIDDLSVIRELASFVLSEHGLEVDMASIKTTENYKTIAMLTYGLAVCLIALGIVAASLMIVSLLRELLLSYQVFLGLFMAFGEKGESLQRIYTFLLLIFLVANLVLAVVLAVAIGHGGLLARAGKQLELDLLVLFDEFTLNGPLAWIFTVCLFGVALVSVARVAGGFLMRPPGDLIYERKGP